MVEMRPWRAMARKHILPILERYGFELPNRLDVLSLLYPFHKLPQATRMYYYNKIESINLLRLPILYNVHNTYKSISPYSMETTVLLK